MKEKVRSKNARGWALTLFRYSCLLPFAFGLAFSFAATPQQADALRQDVKRIREKLLRDGQKAIRKGQYEEAVRAYQQVLGHDGNDVQAHLGAALAHLKDQSYQKCYDHTRAVLKVDPDNARAHALAGYALMRSGYISHAIAELVKAFQLNPKEPAAFGAAAEIDYYEGRAKEARDKAFRAFYLDPNEPDYLITIARSSSRLEYYAEAAEAYERFLRIAPPTDDDRRDRIEGLIRFYRQLAGLQVHELGGAKTTEIPFKLGSDRRPYVKMLINGREANFVIDTGSGFTVISQKAAKKFGVSEIARGGTSQGVGGTGKFNIVYGLIRNLQLGEARIRSVPCFIRPFHEAPDKPADERVDGLIGLSILAHYLTELDYKANVMRLNREENRPTLEAVSPNATIVPFRTTQNGLISIEAEIDGAHHINAILDSAASSSVISTAAVERFKMHDNIIKGQTVRVIGAAGVTDNVELLFLRQCRVADLNHKNVRALVLDFGAINETSGFEQAGILGGDFMRHFRVTIDFARAQVALQPHSSAVVRQEQ
ncbi:MAG TPA: aspartyl protease family protein [Blastocatellia bacterium]|nr:aspartyl protease family protein [Blastocatellia bacterium]